MENPIIMKTQLDINFNIRVTTMKREKDVIDNLLLFFSLVHIRDDAKLVTQHTNGRETNNLNFSKKSEEYWGTYVSLKSLQEQDQGKP